MSGDTCSRCAMAVSVIVTSSLSSLLISPKLSSSSPRLGPTNSSLSLRTRPIFVDNPLQRRITPIWRARATEIPVEATPPESAQKIVSAAGDDGTSVVISALLFAAFIVLSVLTVGVVYIAISDFLQKRETEKFEKEQEEAGKKNKRGKKRKSKARAGPRGFGQKPDDQFGDDDDDF